MTSFAVRTGQLAVWVGIGGVHAVAPCDIASTVSGHLAVGPFDAAQDRPATRRDHVARQGVSLSLRHYRHVARHVGAPGRYGRVADGA